MRIGHNNNNNSFSSLFLSLILFLSTTTTIIQQTHGFSLSSNSAARSSSSTLLWETTGDAAAAPATKKSDNNQAEYGKSLELPDTYVRCGKCQALFAMKEEDLGDRRGRRLECTTCDHSWFQAKDRLMMLKEGFELVARPKWEIERIARNMKENKPPAFLGETKLYVGNIAFECKEHDLYELFHEIGVTVGDVSLVRDDAGKNRGFGFVSLATKKDGETAMEQLNGASLLGRSIAVRESNN